MADLGNPWIRWTSLPCVASLPYFIVRHRSSPPIDPARVCHAVPAVGLRSPVLFMYPHVRRTHFHDPGPRIRAHAAGQKAGAARSPIVGRQHLGLAVLFFFYFYPCGPPSHLRPRILGPPGLPPGARRPGSPTANDLLRASRSCSVELAQQPSRACVGRVRPQYLIGIPLLLEERIAFGSVLARGGGGLGFLLAW